VFEQDRVIVESQRPKPLPLHPKEEVHLRSDRLGVEYRRWIRTLASEAPMPRKLSVPEVVDAQMADFAKSAN